jgi:hypothetical protein
MVSNKPNARAHDVVDQPLKVLMVAAVGCLLAPSFVIVPLADLAISAHPMPTVFSVTFLAAGIGVAAISFRAWRRTRRSPEPGFLGVLGRYSVWLLLVGVGLALYLGYAFTHSEMF